MFKLPNDLWTRIQEFLTFKQPVFENISFIYGGPSCGYGNGCSGSCSESCSGTCNDTCSGTCSTNCYGSEKVSEW